MQVFILYGLMLLCLLVAIYIGDVFADLVDRALTPLARRWPRWVTSTGVDLMRSLVGMTVFALAVCAVARVWLQVKEGF